MKNNVRLQIRCEEDWYVRLSAEAERNGMTVSEYVRTCISLGRTQFERRILLEKRKK